MPSGQLTLKDKAQAQAWVKNEVTRIKRPTVILLSGPIGAGKTQFVRWFLDELGVKDVASPTFSIHHEYQSPTGPIDHVDLYRIKDDTDLEAAGFWDLFEQTHPLIFIEWADRLPKDSWPPNFQQLHIRLSIDPASPSTEARLLKSEH